MKEKEAVIEYIEKLLQLRVNLRESDIGVVSPYSQQCKEISEACSLKGFKDITIGTAETFQGII